MSDASMAKTSAMALKTALHTADVAAEYDARTDKHILRISRRRHGDW